MLKQPRHAQEAMYQARVWERAQRLFIDGYTAVYHSEADEAKVINEEGTVYTVSLLFETCDCPHSKKHGYCKHGLGVQKLLADQTAADEAMCAAHDAEEYGQATMQADRDERLIRETGYCPF